MPDLRDFWYMLSGLLGNPLYEWQKELLVDYITKSPHANLKTMGYTAPEMLRGKGGDVPHHYPGLGAGIMQKLLMAPTQPPRLVDGGIPPDVSQLYNLGFGTVEGKLPSGLPSRTTGFDPVDMLGVIFGGPIEARQTHGPGTRPVAEQITGEGWDELRSRLFYNQVLEPLYGAWGVGGDGKWRGMGQFAWSDFTEQQRQLASKMLEGIMSEQEMTGFLTARSEASRKKMQQHHISFEELFGDLTSLMAGNIFGMDPTASQYWNFFSNYW